MDKDLSNAIIGGLIGGVFTLMAVPFQHWLQRRSEESRRRKRQDIGLEHFQKQFEPRSYAPINPPQSSLKRSSKSTNPYTLYAIMVGLLAGVIFLLQWILSESVFKWVLTYLLFVCVYNVIKKRNTEPETRLAFLTAGIFIIWRFQTHLQSTWRIIRDFF